MRRFKLRYEFWLEPGKGDHEAVMDVIDDLKANRAFAPVVRDGIMIVAELRKGRVDLLLKLFPWVERVVLERIPEPERVLPSSSEVDDLRAEVERLKAWIASSQQVVAEQQPRPMDVTSPPPPIDDDVTLVIKQADAADSNASQNFLDSAFGLQG